jgi:hypothetical protein
MFCPQCRAEYRPGFTHCTDCDVDLIEENLDQGDYLHALRSVLPSKWSAVLWQGTDVHFYLSLFFSMRYLDCPGLGRPAQPPRFESFSEQPSGSYSDVAFELRVSEEHLPFARWVLESKKELTKEEDTATAAGEETAEGLGVSPDVVGLCALCGAEFTTTCSVCPNCGVPLRPPQRGALDHNPAKLLSDLPHPQFLADLRVGLLQAGIPFNNASFPEGPDSRRLDVRVLESDFKRATAVLAQVLQYWEFDGSMGLRFGHDPRASYCSPRARGNHWYPEDLELEVWAGTNIFVLDTLGMALREHQIPYRVEAPQPGNAKIFIHPEDEAEAREMAHDLTQGVELE